MEEPTVDEMDREECIVLLRRCTVGRVAVDAKGTAPLIIPGNYAVDEDDLVFRTDGRTVLGAAAANGALSLEIDDIDHGRHSGWSVLVRGRARVAEEAENDGVELETWAGTKEHWVRLAMDEVTGRRIAITSLPPDVRGYR
jgi:nitroimidazol reductase NimA-like FMN-containing flavoprotein (pyridoxamine 5'-phosphate oxidase superfamily)